MLIALLLVLGNMPPPRPPPPPAQCRLDDDCELSTFAGCCGGCCPREPHAVVKGTREDARCAAVDCEQLVCAAVVCPEVRPASAFVAACRSGRCVALPREQGPAQCRVDLDCRVVVAAPPPGDACHQSACGCCPVTQAVPADAPVPLQQRPTQSAPPPPKNGKPPFGLSPGGPQQNAMPQPQCSPCPAPAEGKAACLGGRCVLAPMPRPLPKPPRRVPPVG